MRRHHWIIGFVLIFMTLTGVFAQTDNATVPDLTGLNVPQAAAALNTAGLALGTQEALDPSEGNGLAVGLIASQSVAAGTEIESGSEVDVSVVREANAVLIYDDNDLTVVNLTNNVADVTGLRFVATEGDSPASFAATRWASNVREKRCLQIWSVARRESKRMAECEDIQHWLTTNVTGEHFWTAANGVQQFAVIENGVERASCPAATNGDTPLRCEFYLEGASAADDIAPYLYMVYTPNAFAIINQTEALWMPIDRTTIFNFNPGLENPGASLIVGDPALFNNPTIVADIENLAPGQCVLLTADNAGGSPPEDCNIIAQRDLGTSVAFWLAEFELESATDGKRHKCPAATNERDTICIVPQ